MSKNYILDDAIVSPLGFDTDQNIAAIRDSKSALKFQNNSKFFKEGYYAGFIDIELIDDKFTSLGNPDSYTKLEKLIILAIQKVLDQNPVCLEANTGLIISTTKGNIDLISQNKFSIDRLYLWRLAQVIADFFNFKKDPIVVSNACVSGALAIKTANDFIEAGRFTNAVVAGGDLVSDFVLSGFQSFQAISPEPCRPFSCDRSGVSLGEAAAAILIGPDNSNSSQRIKYLDAVTVNDANHISGPSRTGEGLYQSISRVLKSNNVKAQQIDYLSAHGTATIYNDEMESIAFYRAELTKTPVNSFKGYFGHTLGTSALIESILTKHSLLNNELFKSYNFTQSGVSKNLNIIEEHQEKRLEMALKTASGFGGCNLAMLLKKEYHG